MTKSDAKWKAIEILAKAREDDSLEEIADRLVEALGIGKGE